MILPALTTDPRPGDHVETGVREPDDAYRRGWRDAAEEAAKIAESIGRPVGAGDGCGTYIPGDSADAAKGIRAMIAESGGGADPLQRYKDRIWELTLGLDAAIYEIIGQGFIPPDAAVSALPPNHPLIKRGDCGHE